MSLRTSTGSSQLRSTAWLPLGISKPNTSSSYHRLLYITQAGWSWEKHRLGADLALHHVGNPRACASSGELQTTSKRHHPAPAQLILHGVWRLVFSGHSQSLQLTGLGKSLPLVYQKQSRLNYKRRAYLFHMKGVPQIPNLGTRGGCATGPYRTYLGHATKTGTHNSST